MIKKIILSKLQNKGAKVLTTHTLHVHNVTCYTIAISNAAITIPRSPLIGHSQDSCIIISLLRMDILQ